MSKYLTRKQVAERYPISFSNLAHMASQGRGIRYKIVGKNAIYRCDDIEAWFDTDVIEPFTTEVPRKRGRPKKQPRLLRPSNDSQDYGKSKTTNVDKSTPNKSSA